MWRALGLAVVAGCSFVFTGSPQPTAPTELPVCTTSRAPIVGDAIAAVPAFVVAGFAVDTDARVALELGVPALAVGVAFIAATLYGLHATSACRDAIDDRLLALMRDADAGRCVPVIAFAKTLLDHDPVMLRAVLANPSFDRCFSPVGE